MCCRHLGLMEAFGRAASSGVSSFRPGEENWCDVSAFPMLERTKQTGETNHSHFLCLLIAGPRSIYRIQMTMEPLPQFTQQSYLWFSPILRKIYHLNCVLGWKIALLDKCIVVVVVSMVAHAPGLAQYLPRRAPGKPRLPSLVIIPVAGMECVFGPVPFRLIVYLTLSVRLNCLLITSLKLPKPQNTHTTLMSE